MGFMWCRYVFKMGCGKLKQSHNNKNQQGKLFESEHAIHFNKQKNNQVNRDFPKNFHLVLIYLDNK